MQLSQFRLSSVQVGDGVRPSRTAQGVVPSFSPGTPRDLRTHVRWCGSLVAQLVHRRLIRDEPLRTPPCHLCHAVMALQSLWPFGGRHPSFFAKVRESSAQVQDQLSYPTTLSSASKMRCSWSKTSAYCHRSDAAVTENVVRVLRASRRPNHPAGHGQPGHFKKIALQTHTLYSSAFAMLIPDVPAMLFKGSNFSTPAAPSSLRRRRVCSTLSGAMS